MSKTAKITILLMLAKILGFVRGLVLASSYGANYFADEYL